MSQLRNSFCNYYNAVATMIHETAEKKGFWGEPYVPEARPDSECIVLIISELTEALEGLRKGNPPDEHLPHRKSAEVELADAIIRIMDYGQARDWNVAEALFDKLEFNKTRPHKHGKEF